MKSNCLLLILGIYAFSGLAKINIIKEHSGQKEFKSGFGCEQNGSCGLKKIFYRAKHKEIVFKEDKYYSTDFYIGYETNSILDIEKFAIVQLINGCQWSEKLNPETGERIKTFNISRDHYGVSKKFVHKSWEIDNTDANPFYSSLVRPGAEDDKFGLLKWNFPEHVDGMVDGVNIDKAIYYYQAFPGFSKVFVTDLPGPGYAVKNFKGELEAKNSNLDFRVCVLPIDAVPYTAPVSGKGIQWNKALACFSWKSSYIYDWDLGKHIEPVLPDSTCKEYQVKFESEEVH